MPSLVNGGLLLRRPIQLLERCHSRYGDIFTLRLPRFGPGCYVADPSAIRELFTGDQSDLLAGEANSFLAPVLGHSSLLVLDGPEHLRHRRLLLPPFQGSRVAEYRRVVREVAEAEVAGWQPGTRLVMRDRMRALTFEVICRVVFGVTEPARVARLRDALAAVVDLSIAYAVLPPLRRDLGRFSPGHRFHATLARADALIYEEIALRRAELAASPQANHDDVLSQMLQARDEDDRPLSDRELRDELITMLAAGHETTATGLAQAFDLLFRTPRALSRLRDEITGGTDDSYLDAVVRETLRLRPVVDAAERTLTRPRTVCGWELPAGIRVYPAIVLVHRRPDLYPDPTAFRPERFCDEGADSSYTWLPFGGGIRRCIGAALAQAEMAEVLRVAVAAVDLLPVRAEPDPTVVRGVTMVPRHGNEMEVVRRRTAPAGAPLAGRGSHV